MNTNKMRVALYYPWVYLTGGAERVIVETTRRSRHEWTIFTNHLDVAATFPELRDRRIVTLPNVSVDRSLTNVAAAGWQIFRQQLPLENFQALMVLCEGLGDLAVFRSGQLPTLCYCLTPLRIAFDQQYQQRYLDRSGWLRRSLLRGGARVFRWIDRRAWRRYDHVFFISHEAARRAVAGGLTTPGDVEILYPASCLGSAEPSDVSEPYFFLPGRIMWTKNVELGIGAYQWMIEQYPELSHFRLIVAGMVDKKSQPYLAELRSLAARRGSIEFRLAPDDAELQSLYSRCYGVLFPPFNEDYGIVPLEGMSFGKPVVAVNRGGPRETVSDGVDGWLTEPTIESFGFAMGQLARHPTQARRMGQEGFDKSRRITWDHFVQQIDAALDRLVGRTTAAQPRLAPHDAASRRTRRATVS